MRKLENERIREWENEEMGCEVVLGEWACASEIKQNLNKIKAAPCKVAEEINFVKGTSYKLAPAEGGIVSLFNFGKGRSTTGD